MILWVGEWLESLRVMLKEQTELDDKEVRKAAGNKFFLKRNRHFNGALWNILEPTAVQFLFKCQITTIHSMCKADVWLKQRLLNVDVKLFP